MKKVSYAPDRCPRCGNKYTWAPVNPQKAVGFSVKRASIGILLMGPLSLIGGSMGRKSQLGKNREYYYCEKCGFEMEYKKPKKKQ